MMAVGRFFFDFRATAMFRAGLLREQPVPGDAPVETEGVRVVDGAHI